MQINDYPEPGYPKSRSEMTEDEFNARIAIGYVQAKSDQSVSVDEVITEYNFLTVSGMFRSYFALRRYILYNISEMKEDGEDYDMRKAEVILCTSIF